MSGRQARAETRSAPEVSLRVARRNVELFIQNEKRYLDLRKLSERIEIVGAVVHDDVAALDKALVGSKFLSLVVPVSDRFQVRVVIDGPQGVLLIGTGMGATGSSIVGYELAFQLKPKIARIVKIGTCVSTWGGSPVGTILVPGWAIADEGATHWDVRWGKGNATTLQEAFQETAVVRAHPRLTNRWHNWLTATPKDNAAPPDPWKTAIWTADTFYPLMLLPRFFSQLAMGYSLEFDRKAKTALVHGVKRSELGTRIMGWDMECSALFSAAEAIGAEACAGIVVSYKADQLCATEGGGGSRRRPSEKKRAHSVEEDLVRQAVEFLFDGTSHPRRSSRASRVRPLK